MNNNFSFDLIRLDLSTIKNVQDCERILFENNIDRDYVDASKAMGLKKDYDTVFLDSKSLLLVAYIKKNTNYITFVGDLVDEMMKMKPINNKSMNSSELTVDFVLDKINKFGLKSLSSKEKIFLESTSKK